MQATVIQPQQYVHPLPLATTRPRRTPASGANRPHRGLRCPPGTYFSPRSLRSNPSDLEENAVLEHKVRPRHRAQPHPRHLPASRGPTPLERAEQQARPPPAPPPPPPPPAPPPRPHRQHPSSRPGRPGPPPAHPCVRQGHHPAHVRPSAYAPGEVPALTQQAASLPIPRSPRASSPAPLRIPASLEERRADVGQHPQDH